jgi:hypothetical protein
MRLIVWNYDDFKTVVNSFGSDLERVFYTKPSSNVVAATALFHSRAQYVQGKLVPGTTSEATFLADFPGAILLTGTNDSLGSDF